MQDFMLFFFRWQFCSAPGLEDLFSLHLIKGLEVNAYTQVVGMVLDPLLSKLEDGCER
jgi:hypothetical protein